MGRRFGAFPDDYPMTAEPVIVGGLLAHIDEHFGSIRKAVDH